MGRVKAVKAPESDKMCREALAHNLEQALALFRAEHSDEWEALRLCPLQHGIEAMVEKLKG